MSFWVRFAYFGRGGSPAERPGLNTGGTPLARVLSDGGLLGTGL